MAKSRLLMQALDVPERMAQCADKVSQEEAQDQRVAVPERMAQVEVFQMEKL